MILDRLVDGAAIDSTVLEWAVREQPEITEQLRLIGTFGPSPIPPWVISKSVSARRRGAIRALFLDMHRDPFGIMTLNEGRIARFVASDDRDYDPIRKMTQAAGPVALGRRKLPKPFGCGRERENLSLTKEESSQ
jgi:phosphonate transport system substrate-binding protein